MTSAFLPPQHLGAHIDLSAALVVANRVYHRQSIPFPYLFLAVIAVVGGVIAYLIWRGQQRRGTQPGDADRGQW